jgi:hypothetical protein
VLDNNGDYFHEQTFYDHHSFPFCPDRPVATTSRSPIIRPISHRTPWLRFL